TVRQVTRGRVFVVFGPPEQTPSPCRALLGRVLERGAHVPIITSDDPCRTAPLTTAHDVLDGFERPHKAQVVPSRAAAIRLALSSALPGDSVLIAGRSDCSSELSHDDRELACQWLYGQAEPQPAPRRFRIVG